MGIFAKIFLVINICYAVYGTFYMSKQRTLSGTPGLATPGGWVPAWQGLGAGIVLWLDFSPWHLIWWLPVGVLIGVGLIWKILTAIGILPKNPYYN
jgi:hypothetical protein